MGATRAGDLIRQSTRQLAQLIRRIHRKRQNRNVHAFRIAVKRLRALTPAFGEMVPDSLEEVFRASGRVRNLSVQRRLIRRIQRSQTNKSRALDEYLRARRRKARKGLRKIVLSNQGSILAFLRQLRKTLRKSSAYDVAAGLQLLRTKRMTELGSQRNLADPAQAHAFRRLVKEILYLNEALGPDGAGSAGLERTAAALGEWHDCVAAQKRVQQYLKKNPRSSLEAVLPALDKEERRTFESAMRTIEESAHV